MKMLSVIKTKRKWSYIYAYNLRTLRDIFVYCTRHKKINEKQLYHDMARNIIPPPKTQWINKNIKRKERLRLEYIHAAEYLNLIKRERGKIEPNFESFIIEKETILEANKRRIFKPSLGSPSLVQSEKWALANIILSYERAQDYLSWFLPVRKRGESLRFNLDIFKKNGKPIYLLGKVSAKKKGSDILKKGVDRRLYKIPSEYIRLVNYVFPSWFRELEVIDKVVVFPDFSEDKQLWHMFYPIKIKDEDFLNKNIPRLLETTFLKKEDKKNIWIPYLIYILALKFGCSVRAIKIALKKVYKEDYEHFYLERTSLSLMKRHSQYEDSYIKVDGFFRSSIILTRRDNERSRKNG